MDEGQVFRDRRHGFDVAGVNLALAAEGVAGIETERVAGVVKRAEEIVVVFGAVLETALHQRWGGPLLDQIPELAEAGLVGGGAA